MNQILLCWQGSILRLSPSLKSWRHIAQVFSMYPLIWVALNIEHGSNSTSFSPARLLDLFWFLQYTRTWFLQYTRTETKTARTDTITSREINEIMSTFHDASVKDEIMQHSPSSPLECFIRVSPASFETKTAGIHIPSGLPVTEPLNK